MSRLFFVGGNWKCNGTKSEVDTLVQHLNAAKFPQEKVEVVVAPPFLALDQVLKTINKEYQVSAQNCWSEKSGAYTGEISAEMILERGIQWVILGHSERRDLFQESDDLIGKKISHALSVGMKVIACVGEHLEEREGGKTKDVINKQLRTIAENVKDWRRVVIAYEPVWAIGTGKTATPQIAQEVHADIRSWLQTHVAADVASSTRIIYGGSVKGSNSDDLAVMSDVDGFLVGGASLIGTEFVKILNSVNSKK